MIDPVVASLSVAAPIVGSFLGVLVVRLPRGGDVLINRSACDDCSHRLAIRDLIPLASWVWQRARCRYCNSRIDSLYPFIELAALGVVLWASTAVSGWQLVVACLLGWALLALAAMDWRSLVLADELTLTLIPAGAGVAYMLEPGSVLDYIVGAAVGYISFTLIAWLYRKIRGRDGLGMGDAKLLAAAGAWVSWNGLPSVVLIGALSGLAFVAAMIIAGRPVSTAQRLPFGTFLCLGFWLVWLYGAIVPG